MTTYTRIQGDCVVHFREFHPSGNSFEERAGNPTAFYDAMGQVALAMSVLENAVAAAVESLRSIGPFDSEAVASHVPFEDRIRLMDRIVRESWPWIQFNTVLALPFDVLDELIQHVFEAAHLGQSVADSRWSPVGTDQRRWIRLSCRPAIGETPRDSEILDLAGIFHIAEYIGCVTDVVADFFMDGVVGRSGIEGCFCIN